MKNPIPPHPDWPVKAYKNLEFLNSPAARTIRVQCEITEPATRFSRGKINHTLVFFGSARTILKEQAEQSLRELEAELEARAAKSSDPELDRRLQLARRSLKNAPYYQAARDLAREMTAWSMQIENPNDRFHICSGGGPGIMEAANRGAQEAGGTSIGMGISLPFEQTNNAYITDDYNFEFHYFFVRKYWLLYLAKALVVFPGGFGTLDELFETLTLIQTRKTEKYLPVILFGSEFWNNLINFQTFIDWGVISDKDLSLFKIMDDVGEARDFLISELTAHHLGPKKS